MVMVMVVAFVVNVLLLYAAGKVAHGRITAIRILVAACMGAMFIGISAVAILSHWIWRLIGLVLTGILAFGISCNAWGNILVFILLHLSLGGITESRLTLSMILGATGIGLGCLLLGRGENLVPVELIYGNQTLHLTALRDTGNNLRDPVTGKRVLVIGADAALQLTGLTPQELRDPIRNLESIPGLRLIPYQTVGSSGFLLAIVVPKAKIGGKQGSVIVALSPNVFGSNYQALTGGMV